MNATSKYYMNILLTISGHNKRNIQLSPTLQIHSFTQIRIQTHTECTVFRLNIKVTELLLYFF